MEVVDTNEQTPSTSSVAIRACDFSFFYPDAQVGIGPLDWSVESGSFQLLVGATGSGKTTLLRCVKTALAPSGKREGHIQVFGRPDDELSAREAAATVGYVAQSPDNQLVCDTVWHELAFGLENLGVSPGLMRRRVAEVAHFFGIEPWFRRLVSELSGGQKQMVTLASVLAMQPRVLLLDEPTAQLDPVAEKNFLHALFRVNRELGITVVVATHAPETMAVYATDAVKLKQGVVSPVSLAGFEQQPLCLSAVASEADNRGARAESSAVRASDVYQRYRREDEWVLRGCDLEVRSGSIHALVGGNGCGKSTLLRLIAGSLKPERGRITNRFASRQAFLPQDPKALFVCDSVTDELREWQHSCKYSDVAVEEVLTQFNLADRTHHHPYDLSGGQQQKLALAKLLLTDPDILLLDEPTKGLDAPSKLVVARALDAFAAAGHTVVLATHDLTFAALVSHEATMLFDGEAVCSEPAAEFFAHNLFYRPFEDAFARLRQKES